MKCNVLILKLKEAVIRKLSTQWQEGYKSKKKKKKKENKNRAKCRSVIL